MKKYLLFTLFLLMAWVMRAQDSNSDIVKVGDKMPSFTIVSDKGDQLSSSSFKGKVVLVNFFATWCPPCQKELAAVQQKLWPKYKDNSQFVLLVIGREHSDADLVKYNEVKDFSFPLYPDKNRSIYGAFANNLIPRSYLIDKSGKVVFTSKGYTDEEFDQLLNEIEKSLK